MHLAVTHAGITVAVDGALPFGLSAIKSQCLFATLPKPADPRRIGSQVQTMGQKSFPQPLHNFGEKCEKMHEFCPN